MQTAGLIRYRRGEMVIVDREGLEDVSCECYRMLRDEFDRLLGPASRPRGRGPAQARKARASPAKRQPGP